MIKATFLAHSGFLVELPSVTLLFDWWKGNLPAIPAEKPLLVFSSHWHEDHFSPAILSLNAAAFILGDMDKPWLAKKGASPDVLERCVCVAGNEVCQPLPFVEVETLPSTDEGVAFIVRADGQTIYHAGDLHWWHWEGEPDPWNPDMERNFKSYFAPLEGRSIDLAMVPLDPRLEGAYDLGLRYFLEHTNTTHVLPMHQWGNFALTERFCREHPTLAGPITPISQEGQHFIF